MPFPLAIIPPLLSFAGMAGSAIANAVGQKKSVQQNNQAQIDLQNLANKQNLEFWHMQNAYNDPSAQMARLRQAGLNPNLAYGMANPGNATAITPAKAPQSQPVPKNAGLAAVLGGFSNIQAVRRQEAETNNLRSQNTVLAQEALLKAAQIESVTANTNKTKFDLDFAKELRDTSAQIMKAQLDAMYSEAGIKSSERDLKHMDVLSRVENWHGELDAKKSEYANKAKMYAEELEGKQLQNKLMQLDVILYEKFGITKNDPIYFRMMAPILKKLGLFNKF